MVKKTIILVFLLLQSFAFAAEPEIDVLAEPNPVQEDDSLLLRINVKVEGTERIEVPSFSAPDFDILGKNNALSTSVRIINGVQTMERTHQFSFVLYPKKSGLLRIQNIEIPIGAQKHKADSVLVTVRPNPGAPINPNPQNYSSNTNDDESAIRFNSDFTIAVQLNKDTAYVGEPIVTEYYLYEFGNVTNLSIKKWPTFNGFWKEDLEIPTRFQFKDAYINNRKMRKALLARFALYPIKPGKLALDKLVVDANYLSTRPNNASPFDDDPFFKNFFQMRSQRNASHASQDISVNVLPLPTEGRPKDFTGAVGKFNISLAADKNKTETNKPLTITFTVSGVGNFHGIQSPTISFPPDFELYESTSFVQNQGSIGAAVPLQNKKDFKSLVIPRKPGTFSIPAVNWNYFDPEKKQYVSLSTNPSPIVVEGDGSAANSNTNAYPSANETTSTAKAPVIETKPELRYLKPLEEILMPHYKYLYNPLRLVFWLFVVLNILLLSLWAIKQASSILKFFRKSLTIQDLLKKEIKKLEAYKNTKNMEAFYASLEKLAYRLLDYHLKKTSIGMTRDEIRTTWKEEKFSKIVLEKIENLLDACEEARYATNLNKNPEWGTNSLQALEHLLKVL